MAEASCSTLDEAVSLEDVLREGGVILKRVDMIDAELRFILLPPPLGVVRQA
ncbi:MAG: hypothetical protein ACE5KH_02545 [Candidatus Geothermarchaeales archaeon]